VKSKTQINEELKQYSLYKKFCDKTKNFSGGFVEYVSIGPSLPVPELDFLSYKRDDCESFTLSVPVVNPFIDKSYIAGLVDLDEDDLNALLDNKKVVVNEDTGVEGYFRGDLVSVGDMPKNISEKKCWYNAQFGLAYLLWARNYYRPVNGKRDLSWKGILVNVAVEALEKCGLSVEDVFIERLLVVPDALKMPDKPDELKDSYNAIVKSNRRAQFFIRHGKFEPAAATIGIIQMHVDKIFNILSEQGMYFKSASAFGTPPPAF